MVNYNGKNYAFVRSENGTEISDELVASSVSEIGFEGEIEASFGAMGEIVKEILA